ncbi:C4-dicarboxylate TRAP transporter substrate-binding protein [Nocardiopsis sp. RSe5-2]|uniref:C4-dicarboxylate TRAP transporter substrate-binding protein n=1 Tax=Nocardiopsis endophytica TaxID=3018445 RepID=A0ABT4TZC0_9ACTN|nr:C4-dicarboxylate TRAP transporter substrate-binding protein [Nocardiopsis endophytica]MDA2810047.1 C4-dicarboxylate TRAP transporter substrate-binding protein [Nocardiopsis endophytica]
MRPRANRPRGGARRLTAAAATGTALAAAAVGLTACGTPDTYVLHYTTYSNPTSDQSRAAQRWADEVEELTGGGVTVRLHYSESLVGADESVQATLDGRADAAQVGSIYAASDLSMFTVVELPFETRNPEVQMRAIERLYEENEVYREDFDRQGVRLLFPLPLGVNAIGTREKVGGLDDLRGMSIRAGGLTSEVMLAAGANPVAMTATDIYESMSRGVVDGYTSLALANLPTFGLSETTPYITDPGIGAYSSSIVVINGDLFDSMPEGYRKALLSASENGIANGLEEMGALGDTSCEELDASGAEFTSLPEEEVAAWKEKAGVAEDWVARYEERGYDARSVLDDYRRIIEEESAASDYTAPLAECMEGAQR